MTAEQSAATSNLAHAAAPSASLFLSLCQAYAIPTDHHP